MLSVGGEEEGNDDHDKREDCDAGKDKDNPCTLVQDDEKELCFTENYPKTHGAVNGKRGMDLTVCTKNFRKSGVSPEGGQTTNRTAFTGWNGALSSVGLGYEYQEGKHPEPGSPGQTLSTIKTTISSPEPWRERESMAEFIARKREMLLLRMSLETKMEEIQKLDDGAKVREDSLVMRESMLGEDQARFETLLKESEHNAQDAIRRARQKVREKMEMVHAIKRIGHQVQAVQADISKHQESLEDCLKYKNFLDQLTPADWFEEKLDIKRERQKRRRRERIDRRKESWRKDHQKRIEDVKARMNKNNSWAANGQRVRRRRHVRIAEVTAELDRLSQVPEPDFDDETLTSSDEDLPIYFERPEQLLDLFPALEEENIFLIQNAQENQQELDGLKKTFSETRRRMNEKANLLGATVEKLLHAIDVEKAKATEKTQRRWPSDGHDMENKEKEMKVLEERVKEIYLRCGFGDDGSNVSILSMLSDLEARAEELLATLDTMPRDHIKKAEKDKATKRRQLRRTQKQKEQERVHEERRKKTIERSLEPPKKRTGRPVMFRSQLAQKKLREKKREMTQEELDEERHLSY